MRHLGLVALAADARRWRHGWSLASETGLRIRDDLSMLIRLAQAGLLEARWEPRKGGAVRRVMPIASWDRDWCLRKKIRPIGEGMNFGPSPIRSRRDPVFLLEGLKSSLGIILLMYIHISI